MLNKGTFQSLDAKRTRQMVDASLLSTVVTTATFVTQAEMLSSALLMLCLAGLIYARICLLRNNVNRAFGTMILSLSATLVAMTWMHNGLRDITILGYSFILMLIVMAGLAKMFALALGGFSLSLVALTWMSESGIYQPSMTQPGWYTLCYALIFLSLTGAAGWLTVRDKHATISLLEAQMAKVEKTHARAEYLARHDELTKLPNRGMAEPIFNQLKAVADSQGEGMALAYIDIDDFKTVNDSLGIAAGDILLMETSRSLSEFCREQDFVCRKSGDQFLYIHYGIKEEEDALPVIESLSRHLNKTYWIDNVSVAVTSSVGLSIYPKDGSSFDMLMKHADLAMYKAKERGKNSFFFFNESLNSKAKNDLRLLSDMRDALDRNEFILHYQPQMDIHSGKITGAEALIRWQHPEAGLIYPDSFIQLAERSGLIIDIGQWVINEACRQQAEWSENGIDIIMAINLSAVQFRRNDVHVLVKSALNRHMVPASRLKLEMTESVLIEDEDCFIESLRILNEYGVSFSIDDFGTGYSNFAYLRKLNVSQIKIDKSFVFGIAESSDNKKIVKAIIEMAKSLGLENIAEGVEDPETLHELIALGCSKGQGYLWSKPVTSEEFCLHYTVQNVIL